MIRAESDQRISKGTTKNLDLRVGIIAKRIIQKLKRSLGGVMETLYLP